MSNLEIGHSHDPIKGPSNVVEEINDAASATVKIIGNDYDNKDFVNYLHEVNREDTFSRNAAINVESVILNNKGSSKYESHLELGAGSQPIPYPNIFEQVEKIFWTDVSGVELDLAKEELKKLDIENKEKIIFKKQSFLDAIKEVEDGSIDSIGMRFCINYLAPKEMPLFFSLLRKKLKKGGVLVANIGIANGILPVHDESAKYLHNGKEIKEDSHLQDEDKYTIIFLDEEGKPKNNGTTKIRYSEKYFDQFSDDNLEIVVAPAKSLSQNPATTPMKMLLIKKINN